MKKKKKLSPEEVLAGPGDWLTIVEVAAIFKCSPITLRRRIARGQANGMDLMDPFEMGKPMISTKSVREFIARRQAATHKEFKPAPHLYVA